jgi:hypothetical protein
MKLGRRGAACLAAVGLMAAYLIVAPSLAPRGPFAGPEWEIDSVMVMDPYPATYALSPPFRVVRGERVTVDRRDAERTLPVIRVDLTIDGEHVLVFARLRQPISPGGHRPAGTADCRPPG